MSDGSRRGPAATPANERRWGRLIRCGRGIGRLTEAIDWTRVGTGAWNACLETQSVRRRSIVMGALLVGLVTGTEAGLPHPDPTWPSILVDRSLNSNESFKLFLRSRGYPAEGAFSEVNLLFMPGVQIVLDRPLHFRDAYIGAYNDAGAKPILRWTNESGGIVSEGGRLAVVGLQLEGGERARYKSAGVNARKADIVYVVSCVIDGFANGIVFAGHGGEIKDNQIRRVTNSGIFGGWAPRPAPSNFLIDNNFIDARGATNDGITLHDGTSLGLGNRISRNVIEGPAENGIDILGQFAGTIIQKNRISNTGLYAIITTKNPTGDKVTQTQIVENEINGSTRAGIYSRTLRALVRGNKISGIESIRAAAGVAVEGPAEITDNTIMVPKGAKRPAIAVFGVPESSQGGLISRNRIENASIVPIFGFHASTESPDQLIARWNINDNHYVLQSVSSQMLVGQDPYHWIQRIWRHDGSAHRKDTRSRFDFTAEELSIRSPPAKSP